MPNWAGSCWYYLRYIDPHNNSAFADPQKMEYWLPVDRYFGGSEHTTLHLLYSRFWHQFLFDQKLVPTPEPYAWRINGGILLGEDGVKQSKSRGNVVDLNQMLELYGADALRLYICFIGPYDATLTWNEGGLKACRKVVENIYALRSKVGGPEPEELTRACHRLIKRVSSMIDRLKMNTAVAEFMIFVNAAKKAPAISPETWQSFLRTLAPFAVFIAEELWQQHQQFDEWQSGRSIHLAPWPTFDPALAEDETVVVGVQVNGRLRAEVEVGVDQDAESVRELTLALPKLEKWLEGREVKKFIYVPKKIVSIVVK